MNSGHWPVQIWFFTYVIILLVSCKSDNKDNKVNKEAVYQLLIGSYTGEEESQGVYLLELDRPSGKLKMINQVDGGINPSFLTFHPNGEHFYVVNEYSDFNQYSHGGVGAFSIDVVGNIDFINRVSSLGKHPCHVSVSSDYSKVMVANYSSGNVSLYSILDDGALSEPMHQVQHQGNGPTSRQKGPHAHMVYPSPKENIFYATDLGTDHIYIYHIEADTFRMHKAVATEPGAGPRQLDFDDLRKFAYVVGELNGTVEVFGLPAWNKIQTIKTVNQDTLGPVQGADIHMDPAGNYVFVSNRGEYNSITVFSRDSISGKLTRKYEFASGGQTPRNFLITPDGNYLLCANQNSNNVVVFRINPDKGQFLMVDEIQIFKPVCIQVRP